MVIKHFPHFRIRPEMRGIFVMLLFIIMEKLFYKDNEFEQFYVV